VFRSWRWLVATWRCEMEWENDTCVRLSKFDTCYSSCQNVRALLVFKVSLDAYGMKNDCYFVYSLRSQIQQKKKMYIS